MTEPTNKPITVEQILDDFALSYTSEYISLDDKFDREVIDFEELIKRKEEVYKSATSEATTQINALIAKARLDELARGKEYVTKLRDVWLTQENKLDGEDPLAEKGIAIRNHLRDEIVEDFDARIAELQQLLQKGEK